MRIVQQVGEYETNRADTNEHLSGMVEVINEPPPNLECPDTDDIVLRYDVFMIDTDSADPRQWKDCRAQWDEKDWLITEVLPVENNKRAIVYMDQLPHYRVILHDLWEDKELEHITPADDRTHAGVIARRDNGSMDRYKVVDVSGPLYYDKPGKKWTDAKTR